MNSWNIGQSVGSEADPHGGQKEPEESGDKANHI
jgi:hypothetical protein